MAEGRLSKRDGTHDGPTSTKPPSSFQFVTFTHVDHMRDTTTLSRIRRHAMKDIGVQRRKPKRKRFVEVALDVPLDFGNPMPAVGGGALHTFFNLPLQLDSIGKALFTNIFQSDQTAHREDWFTVSLADPGTFNQVLANSELHLEALRNPHHMLRETPTSIYYHQLAVRAVREQLAKDPVNVSDAVIGTITGMIIYAEISGVLAYWLPQRKGLIGVLESREGGIASIENDQHLRATVSWTELRGSYVQDIPSAIPLPKAWTDMEYHARSTVVVPQLPQNITSFLQRVPLGSSLLDLMLRLSTLCQYARSAGGPSTLPGADIIICENVIAHHLLAIRPEEDTQIDKPISATLEACRLAMLLFIAPIYRNFGAVPINMQISVAKQHRLLLDGAIAWEGLHDLRLWVLFVSALEATDVDIRAAFIRGIEAGIAELAIVNKDDVLTLVRDMMWISEIFDARTAVLLGEIGTWI